jgi:hypothetical protein
VEPPAAVKIVETIPAGWTAASASDGGTIQGRTITWNLTGAAIANGKQVTYQLGPAPKGLSVAFSGMFEVQGTQFRVKGATTLPRAPLPAEDLKPWIAVDIGAPPAGGQERISENSFNIWGGGADISLKTDSFRFIHQASPGGDFSMWVRVDGQDPTNPFAKAGLMARQSLDPGSTFYFVQATPKNGAGPRWRATANANAVPSDAGAISAEVTLPVWLKMERKGDLFSGYTSVDGVTWTQNYRTAAYATPRSIGLTSPPLLGFAVTAKDAAKISGVMFREYNCVGPGCPGGIVPPTGFHRGDTDTDGAITIGDAIFLLNYIFASGPLPKCLDACDMDDTEGLTIGDPVYLLNYQFVSGPAPLPPGPPGNPCGPDPSGTDLDCKEYPASSCK